jgi:3-hydroxybutyryl-CoA dehydratase
MTPAPHIMVGQSASLTRTLAHADAATLARLVHHEDEALAGQMMITALWSTLLGMTLPGQGTNYLKQETRFLAPTPWGVALTARVTVTRVRLEKGLVDLETVCLNPAGAHIAEGRALVQARDTGRLPQP